MFCFFLSHFIRARDVVAILYWPVERTGGENFPHALSRFREGVELVLHEAFALLLFLFFFYVHVFRVLELLPDVVYLSLPNVLLLLFLGDVRTSSGLIYIVNRLDYEARSKYELLVRATDSVSGAHSEVPVSVSVEDANDSPPEFGYNEYNVTLSEATPSGTVVLAVAAHDHDSGKLSNINILVKVKLCRANLTAVSSVWLGINAQVVYRLLPDTNGGQDGPAVATAPAEFFHMNPEDGTLILVRSLDRETQSQHHLLVMASDQGSPSLSSTAHIWIRGLLTHLTSRKLELVVFNLFVLT